MTSAIFSQQASSCQGLIYSILQNPQLSTGRYGFRAALVAAHPGAGTTHMTTILAESLNQDAAQSAIPLDGRELATLCGDPRAPAENIWKGGNATAGQSSPTAFNGSWSWRGSHDYRAAYLEQLQERFP
jgi:hypothetical protein